MKEPTETTRWTVTTLLIIAALDTIWLTHSVTNLGFIILIATLVACGVVAAPYPPYK